MKTLPATAVLVSLVSLLAASLPARAKDGPAAGPASRPTAATAEDVAQLREQVRALAAAIDVLRAEVAALRGKAPDGPAAPAAAPSAEQIDAAVKDGRVMIGMTKEQARAALGRSHLTFTVATEEETAVPGGRVVRSERWDIDFDGGDPQHVLFKDGRVISVRHR